MKLTQIAVRSAMLTLVSAGMAAPVRADSMGAQRFECQLRLASQAGFSAPAPVTIAFSSQGKIMRDIHVVDIGGILFPGGNLAVSKRADGTVVMGGKPVPQERPGAWSGRISKKAFDLELTTSLKPKAVVIKLGTKASRDGLFPLLWQATGDPMMPGMPSISGSGTGGCRAVAAVAPTS